MNCISALAQANANPPERLTYQGFLADGNGVALATNAPKNYDVVFRIWDGQTGGTNAWTEQQTVTVDKGFFSVLLGEGTQVTSPATEPHGALSTLFTNATASDRYVEMTVKGIGAAGADVKILPRLRLLTAPYAYLATKAISANSVDGGAVTSGTVPDVRLSPNVALLNLAQTFTAIPTFGSGLRFNSSIQSIGGNARGGNSVDLQTERSGVNSAVASGPYSVIGGGAGNTASGYAATAPGGYFNTAAGDFSFAAGANAKANHAGSFVWADWQAADFASTAANQFLIRAIGGVGIGTTTPAGKLDVAGDVWIGASIANRFNIGGNQIQYYANGAYAAMYLNLNGGNVILCGGGVTPGNVGIGTGTPGVPLDVQTTGPVYNSGGGLQSYFQAGGPFLGNTGPGAAPYNRIGIRCSGGIQALAFVANSDQRIKTIQGRSDGVRDLGTLLDIEVTDFTYLDTLAKGTGKYKKVIAQQVENVFPQAVSKSTDVVPDIYQKAEVKGGWVKLATNLKKGERVRLIGEKKEGIHEVLEVAEGRFRTEFKPEGDKVFVYGREVKDFRSVDYEAISMLNVSATQELARRLEKLEARETHLAELEQKAARVATLEQDVADLKKMVAQLAKPGKGTEQAAHATTPSRPSATAPVGKTVTTASLER